MKSYEELLEEAKQKLPEINEASERLEIPAISAQIVGRQTVIKNFGVITKAIRREPQLVAKYLFKELAVPGTIHQGELSLLGKIKEEVIQKRLTDFVKDYVICHECGKPDTKIEIFERNEFIKCEACGAKRTMKKI